MITIKNDFHNTAVKIAKLGENGELTDSQIRRIRNALCGVWGCTCGGVLSERGPQDIRIETIGYDVARWIARVRLQS